MSLSAQLANPPENRSPSRGNPWVADASVFLKGASSSEGSHTDSGVVTLEQQPVAGTHPQCATDVAWHRNLAFACDTRLFLHG